LKREHLGDARDVFGVAPRAGAIQFKLSWYKRQVAKVFLFHYAPQKRNTMVAPALIEVLKKCVATPSVNPAHSSNPDESHEFRMADALATMLSAKGFDVEWDRADALRPNVIGRYGPANPQRTLLFESHLDTVGVADMVIPPFRPEVRGGRLYGRGACDTKGPMAAALHAMTEKRLQALAQADVQIVFAGAMGEEHGNLGAEQLVARGLGADAAIILEPTDQHIVFAHKGVLWMEINLTGTAAHASTPEKGRSAISAMAQLIASLEQYHDEDVQRYTHPDLGSPTQNIGMIRGGEAVNIVAHQCQLQLDRRFLPDQSTHDMVQFIEKQIAALIQSNAVLDGSVRIIKEGSPFVTPCHSGLVSLLQSALRDAGVDPVMKTAGWFSDAGPFSKTCEDLVVFGPGSISQAHTVDEFIEVEELQKGADILGAFLDRFSRSQDGASS
jgi:acetylornithine deacetylase/succinyl-diaminopimelate desuccinylase family protein